MNFEIEIPNSIFAFRNSNVREVDIMADFINLSSIGQRIRQIFEESGLSASDFCRESGGIPSSTFSQMLNGSVKVNVATINRIVERWGHDYPPLWILLGDDMYTYTGGGAKTAGAQQEVAQGASSERPAETQALIDEIVALRSALAAVQPKTIDKITIFYSDKNYEVYRLSDD